MSSSTAPHSAAADYLPVIDLSAATDRDGKLVTAKAVGAACENSGFFTIVGHDVGQELIDRMYASSRGFFELPAEEKAKVSAKPGSHGLRTNVSASRGLGKKAPPDLGEIFVTCVRGDDSPEKRAALGDPTTPWASVNRWPSEPAGFREVWEEYTAAMEALARNLIELFALALGFDEHFFDDKIDNDMSTIAANYYYPLTSPPLPGQLRRGPHTDWGDLTILYQDDVGGLEVEQKGYGWRGVPFIQNSFVVNIGDLMAFWTGGRWVSTMHRVRNPVEGHTGTRISIPFFHMPNHDAPVEPLFPFTDAYTEERFKTATTPGEWYMERLQAVIS